MILIILKSKTYDDLRGSIANKTRPSAAMSNDLFAPELFQTDDMTDPTNIFAEQNLLPMEHSSPPEFMRKDSVATDFLNGLDAGMDTIIEDDSVEQSLQPEEGKKKERSTKQRDPDKLKDTKHSSKNEGQHTDRRYLCYICHKLFTRRRSVRDHLNKIHGEKTWEPQRSLEVVVEPHTGEPIESIEDIIARGPPAPASKSEKASKTQDVGASASSKPETSSHEDVIASRPDEAEDLMPALLKTESSAAELAQEALLRPEARITMSAEPEAEKEPEAEPQPEIPKLKMEPSQSESRPASTEPSQPAPIIGKKRPLAATKKGTAKVKSSTPSKRLKLTESERSTPARSPSVTPAQRIGSKLKKPVTIPSPSSRASSRQPSPSPSPSVATPASSNDDGEIFCICRKGDNHTWMIACDGPCEEWFHGKCVGIKERDGELIDKYICPNCSKDGFITTWKRMCRRRDCRKPARVKDDPPSKYCSVECGRRFFVELIQRGDPGAMATKDGQYIVEQSHQKKHRKRIRRDRSMHSHENNGQAAHGSRPHTPAYSEEEKSEYETDSSLDEDQLPNRGGALRAGELKALMMQCRTVDEWRALGKKPETPPREVDHEVSKLPYDDYEKDRRAAIKNELAQLDERMAGFEAREKVLEMIKTRSASIADDIKKSNPKLKDICGYDPRIGWCEAEFLEWYNGEGKQIIESGKIGPPTDATITDSVESNNENKTATTKGGVCIRNRCPKHGSGNERNWRRAQLAEIRFGQDLIKKQKEKLEKQDHDIRSRAQIRALEQGILA